MNIIMFLIKEKNTKRNLINNLVKYILYNIYISIMKMKFIYGIKMYKIY